MQRSLAHSSPLAVIPANHMLTVLQSYFDGGNEADSTQYDIVTLAAITAPLDHWLRFSRLWKQVLRRHGAPYLHTTDAVGLTGPFAKDKGWNRDLVSEFISDCVTVIGECAAQTRARIGILPITTSVILKDFQRVVQVNPDIGTAEGLCAMQSSGTCFMYGEKIGMKRHQLFFDRGEPFRGHAVDRWTSRHSKRTDKIWESVDFIREVNMRDVPALQAADLFAWAINAAHQDGRIRYNWQERVLNDIEREKYWLDYEELQKPNWPAINLVKTWKLPQRRRSR